MNNWYVACVPVLVLVQACGGTKPKPTPSPLPPVAQAEPAQQPAAAAPQVVDDGKPVEVDLKVEAVTAAGQGYVEFGQRLRAGDKLALHVTPSDAAYVYVALASTNEAPTLLYPRDGGPGVVAAGETARVPAVGKWFKLDGSAGREDIYVYAAKKPLFAEDVLARVKADAEAERLAAAQAEAASRRKKTKRSPKGKADALAQNEAPGLVTAETRALELVDDEPAEAGVTKKHFSIKHAR